MKGPTFLMHIQFELPQDSNFCQKNTTLLIYRVFYLSKFLYLTKQEKHSKVIFSCLSKVLFFVKLSPKKISSFFIRKKTLLEKNRFSRSEVVKHSCLHENLQICETCISYSCRIIICLNLEFVINENKICEKKFFIAIFYC